MNHYAAADVAFFRQPRAHLLVARDYFKSERYSKALLQYSYFLSTIAEPNDRLQYRDEYLSVLENFYSKHGVHTSNIKHALAAVGIFGNDFLTQQFLARTLFIGGYKYEAICECARAVALTRTPEQRLHALIALENARSHAFDQWFFPMINDRRRNEAFARGIVELVAKLAKSERSDTIQALDLGAGCGLLSVLAVRELRKTDKEAIVTAVEANLALASVATAVFCRNRVSVKLEAKHSTEFEHDRRFNLILCELLDCAIFGERIVSSLVSTSERANDKRVLFVFSVDVYDRLACRELCFVLPRSATFVLALVEAASIEQQHFYEPSDFYQNGVHVLISGDCYLNRLKHDSLPAPYDSEQLDDIAGGYRLLSEPQDVFTVDFTHLQQLRSILRSDFHTTTSLFANVAGRAAAAVGWFRLKLGTNITLSTGPGGGRAQSCWPQAIFPFYPPQNLAVGDTLEFGLSVLDERLFARPMSLSARTRTPIRASEPMCFAAMNSAKLREFYEASINSALRRQDCAIGDEPPHILDTTDLLIERSPTSDRQFRLSCSSQRPIIRYTSANNIHDVGNQDVSQRYTAILHYPFGARGQLDAESLARLAAFVRRCGREPPPLLVPARCRLVGQLVCSADLSARSTIIAPTTSTDGNDGGGGVYAGVNIEPMKQFNVRYFEEIEMRTLRHETLTERHELARLDFGEYAKNGCTLINRDVELRFSPLTSAVVEPRRVDALVYWYEIESDDDAARFSLAHLPRSVCAFVFSSSALVDADALTIRVSFSGAQPYFECLSLNEPPPFRVTTMAASGGHIDGADDNGGGSASEE